MHPAVEACCVTGANLGQPIGLLMLSEDAARKRHDPTGRVELERSLGDLLKAVNATLDPHEQMDCLVVMSEAWTVDNDLITPTMKVKRNRIEDAFASHFKHWVRIGTDIVWHEQ